MGDVDKPHLIKNMDKSIIRKVSRNLDTGIGKIVGGNITMIQTTLGTENELDTEGKILLLEEVGESSYSIERTLEHLAAAGKFENPAAIVFGEFSNIKREPVEDSHDANPSVNEILAKLFNDTKYPVLMGYNFSHGNHNLTLPIGATGKVDSRKRTFEII
jgi:muramoyltetrapeptide carboxypeptidase